MTSKLTFSMGVFLWVAVFLAGCKKEVVRDLEDIKKEGVLRVVSRMAGTTFYKNADDEYVGFEYEVAKAFADFIGVKLQMVEIAAIPEVMGALNTGEGDVVASGMTITKARSEEFAVSRPYHAFNQVLVCNKKFQGEGLADLNGVNILIVGGSTYEQNLNFKRTTYPFLKWNTIQDLSSGQVLQLVWEGGPDCTVVDSHIAAVNRRYMPELKVIESVSDQEYLGWYFNKINLSLKRAVDQWMDLPETQSLIQRLKLRYFGGQFDVARYEIQTLQKKVKEVLPKYKALFKRAEERYGIDWELLAAISFQESAWEADSSHPNGGKGLMSITSGQAKEAGFLDISQPAQNIFAGAKRLQIIYSQWPSFISDEDRKWLSVAAFKMGHKHIQDARRVAIELNFNPNSWEDIGRILPLLSQKRYYQSLKHGFAQGVEPVVFVRRVQSYVKILENRKGE